MVKNRLDLFQSKINKSEPGIFYGSTSSLNSGKHFDTSQSKINSCRSQQKYELHKTNSLGHMLKSMKNQWLIPVSERGVPEGQEDPQKFNSSNSLNEKCLYNMNSSVDLLSSDSEWSSEIDDSSKKIKSSYLSG